MMYKPFDLSGKVALVTGGNGGIGLGMAEALAQSGADVVIWGTNEAKNTAAGKKLAAYGKRVASRRVDVSNEAEVVEAMKAAIETMGRVDCVIANAGIGGGAPIQEMTTELFRRVHAVNEDGVMWTFREAAKHMIDRAKAGDANGSLVVVASTAGIEGAARNSAYGASKGAVMSMARALAVELARYGVRCNSIAPGWIATDMTAGAQANKVFAEKVIPRVPARRWGTPEDFGGIAVYLASDASAYHTGEAFVIDGGYTKF
ncbi:MAG: SDR family oxidoreductase [Alphaproteobacteria bacterium]|nr:SDR family oxidoreductase [Alphaproteobacteria bacterium]MBN9567191.1 SDR family oxidoreductase [Alphaproteobacteria bacterium]MBN9578696.1 SDR family oxidoreductase [Alphaproteobacteria bacterium]OJU56369.1 MAG: 2-deoxy-D-gluconate 3-dehydrogenase [Alphaproteobacteria bacterium 62-8]